MAGGGGRIGFRLPSWRRLLVTTACDAIQYGLQLRRLYQRNLESLLKHGA